MPPFRSEELSFADSHPMIREVHAYWLDKQRRAGGPPALPRRADIQPWELKPHLGRINLLDIRRDPEDFVYRLYGTAFADLVRQELNGRSVREVRPESYACILLGHFRCARDRAAPLVHGISLNLEGKNLDYQRLCLPFSRHGGPQAEVLLTYAVTGKWDAWAFEQNCLTNDQGP